MIVTRALNVPHSTHGSLQRWLVQPKGTTLQSDSTDSQKEPNVRAGKRAQGAEAVTSCLVTQVLSSGSTWYQALGQDFGHRDCPRLRALSHVGLSVRKGAEGR